MSLKFKAAVLREIGLPRPYAHTKPLSIETVELDPPGPDELLVRIKAAGLCHSDLSAINGDRPWPMPIVLGHEAAAEVVELGPGSAASGIAVGDHVVLVFRPSCGSCAGCAIGRPALCEPGAAANASGSLLGGYKRLGRQTGQSRKPERLNHHLGCAAFAEYAVVSRRSVVKIDASLPWDQAALFGCAVLTGAGAVFNTAEVKSGASVAVVGLGGVGFSAVMAAVAAGASEVVALDVLPEKLERAKALGATRTYDAREPSVIAQVKADLKGGADFGLEMAGAVAALDLAYQVTRRGGTTVTAGLPHPAAAWPLQAVSLTAEERTVKGSYIGSCIPARDVPRFVALFKQGKLPVDRLLDERLRLEDINAGFDRLAEGRAVRQVILF